MCNAYIMQVIAALLEVVATASETSSPSVLATTLYALTKHTSSLTSWQSPSGLQRTPAAATKDTPAGPATPSRGEQHKNVNAEPSLSSRSSQEPSPQREVPVPGMTPRPEVASQTAHTARRFLNPRRPTMRKADSFKGASDDATEAAAIAAGNVH